MQNQVILQVLLGPYPLINGLVWFLTGFNIVYTQRWSEDNICWMKGPKFELGHSIEDLHVSFDSGSSFEILPGQGYPARGPTAKERQDRLYRGTGAKKKGVLFLVV